MVFFLSASFVCISTVGFLPVKATKNEEDQINFTIFKPMMLKSCLQALLLYYSLYTQAKEEYMDEIGPDKVHYSGTLFLATICLTYVIHVLPIVCILQVRNKLKVFKNISELVVLLKDSGSASRTRVISYVTMIYSCYGLAAYAYCLREEYTLKVMFLNDFLKFVFISAIVEFYEVVSDIKDCFQNLNFVLPETMASWYFNRNLTPICVRFKGLKGLQADLNLKDILELHRQLCCVVEKINSVYGYQNFVIVVFIFLQLIYCPLELLALPSHYHTWPVIVHCINHSLVYLVGLYVLVRPCTHVANEAQRTVAILSKLMGQSVSEATFKELEEYCRQLFLRKVEFSACGFFTLEIPLILSMLSVVTTYFTIILQFQMSDTNSLSTTETASQNFTWKP